VRADDTTGNKGAVLSAALACHALAVVPTLKALLGVRGQKRGRSGTQKRQEAYVERSAEAYTKQCAVTRAAGGGGRATVASKPASVHTLTILPLTCPAQ